MKKLNLITFASSFQRQEEGALREAHNELFSALDGAFDVHMYIDSRMSVAPVEEWTSGTTVVFISSGGTEGMVVKRYHDLPKPVVLLTDGKANSLAASLELSCWMRAQGDKCTIIHGDTEDVVEQLKAIGEGAGSHNLKADGLLKGARIGVIGEPSDWLVASGVDYMAAKESWGVEYIDIPLQRVEDYFHEDDADVKAEAELFTGKAQKVVEPTMEEVEQAVRLYHALKRITAEEHLDALTLQCFSLIPTLHTTGCLALALLNDDGVVAGCEGDLQSVFTLLLAKRATGIDGFMANPSLIDSRRNQLTIAHCTIGLRQTEKYIVRSHFESLSGVAIQGILKTGPVTILKCGGKDLSRWKVLTGTIVENQDDPRKCRTQLLIQLDDLSPVSYFLNDTIGNHHIVIQGNHRDTLTQLLSK